MTVPDPNPPTDRGVPDVLPRKRRRRAPASGAADDCFACHKRSIKCDRRRPYCSPCLEIGRECSGYKTQLTWGVGVASRGKLRGLSLPVAKSAPAARSPPRGFARPRSSSTISKLPFDGAVGEEEVEIKLEGEMPMLASPRMNYDFVHMNPRSPGLMHSSAHSSDWTSHEPRHVRSGPSSEGNGHLLRQSLQRLQPPMMRYGEDFISSSAGSLGGYGDTDYSPVGQSYVDDGPYLASPMPLYDNFSHHGSPADQTSLYGMSVDRRGPTSYPDQFYPNSDISSSLSSHLALFDIAENRRVATSPALCNTSDTDYDEDVISKSAMIETEMRC